ncbi:MAG: phytoene/squalene synthase family protein [Pseudomonadota bacterium]
MLDNTPTGGPFASYGDLADCRAMIRTGSRSFHAASLLLAERVRMPAYALYAFCRLADDGVDLASGKAEAVTRLRRRLAAIYDGHPEDFAADRAFADTVRQFGIPAALPEALLEGLAWDAIVQRYQTLSELRAYSARVASTVGTMMSLIMGVRCPDTLARACDLGVAMQLTNIARDIGEDARAGRIYLPLDWLAEAGIDPDHLIANPVFTPALGDVANRLLVEADTLYRRSEAGIQALPLSCRPAIFAARHLYAEIGAEIARNGYDSVSQRAIVSGKRKRQLMTRVALSCLKSHQGLLEPALPETEFLVDAVLNGPAPQTPQREVGSNLGRLIEMLAEMEDREKTGLRAPGGVGGTA